MGGALDGVTILDFSRFLPGAYPGWIAGDLGADVIRVERPGGQPLTGGPHDLLNRGRPSVALDLKNAEAVTTVLDLVRTADVDANNRVLSTRVADAQISYTGKGDVARAGRQGWLSRFFSVVSPF